MNIEIGKMYTYDNGYMKGIVRVQWIFGNKVSLAFCDKLCKGGYIVVGRAEAENLLKEEVIKMKRIGEKEAGEVTEVVPTVPKDKASTVKTFAVGDKAIYKGKNDALKGKPCEVIRVRPDGIDVKFKDGKVYACSAKSLE